MSPETVKTGGNASTLKYPRPKILLVDVPEAKDLLEVEGYNVSTGSFGYPYMVPMSDDYTPVIPNGELYGFSEQEVVVVNLKPTHVLYGPIGEKVTSDGELDVWVKCSTGVVDPRPRLMSEVCSSAEKIYASGGLFVVFAAARRPKDQFIGRKIGYYPSKERDFPFDNWTFFPS